MTVKCGGDTFKINYQILTMQRLNFIGQQMLSMRFLLVVGLCCFLVQAIRAQTITHLNDLSAFKDPGKTWKIVGGVHADITKPNVLKTTPGSGVILNLPDKKTHGVDLYTREEFGDMDLELDYMMAKGSNSGIYVHGRYEIQLHDSWTVRFPTSGNNGGIYERWDESRPKGQNGFEGHPPRLNASRAPGLWQHMKISFQAPRFDGSGKKIQPAKILRLELNGALIHEDVELTGPTRGAAGEEKATGPLRFQGDHGAVAFRNIQVSNFGQARPESDAERPYRVYPILVKSSDSPAFRSFMDLPGGIRVVHAVSAGSAEKVHYTYDTDTGMIIQVWRGDFLDATPMWHSRGDGSSRPVGAVQILGNPVLAIAKLATAQTPWKSDTTGTRFRPKGYILKNDRPVFQYLVHGIQVTDATEALSTGEGLSRQITISRPAGNLYVRLGEGETIRELEKGFYAIGGNSYYVRIDDGGGSQAVIRNGADGKKELIVPIATTLTYSLLF